MKVYKVLLYGCTPPECIMYSRKKEKAEKYYQEIRREFYLPDTRVFLAEEEVSVLKYIWMRLLAKLGKDSRLA